MNFEIAPSYKISKKKRKAIASLLAEAFPSYPADEIYYKQMPCFHLLAWDEQDLIGHASVHHRQIYVDNHPVRIFGVADLCVSGMKRHQGVGKSLLDELNALGQKGNIEYIVAITDEHEFYEKQGFKSIQARARWILLSQNQMLGINERAFNQDLYIRSINQEKWPAGVIDFMGPLF